MTLVAEWIDGRRFPQNAPNPAYPDGVAIDMSKGAKNTCRIELAPYPTPRCGYFVVTCNRCGLRVTLTTAGRRDDPRSLKVACRR